MERLTTATFVKIYWWKLLGALLVLYSILAGLLVKVPLLPIVEESIRNVFFHVCMWFAMIAVFINALVNSILYLSKPDIKYDRNAVESVHVGVFFGVLGLITGMVWAKATWGAYWVNDPKLNGAAVCMLAYLAYLVLRSASPNQILKARLSAVYNIFAFVILIVFVIILPRIADGSLHPGSGGESPFAVAKMQGHMYAVFFPAFIGWILMAFWLVDIRVRINKSNEEMKNEPI